jgi:hypothetical protein
MGVQIDPCSQHELLGHEGLLARPEQRRKTLLGRLHRAFDAATPRSRELERLGEAPVGDGVATAEADPSYERALARHVGDVGIGGGGPLRAQGAIEDLDASVKHA